MLQEAATCSPSDTARNPVFIAPSILSADFLRLGAELEDIEAADLVHFDVMDGNFVPNLSFGPDILRHVKAASPLPVDVHLMVTNPDEVVAQYLASGADRLTFHWEAARHAHRIVAQIHEAGALACIALNPATPVFLLQDILGDLDMVLVMTVNPGFGGQAFIERSYAKLRQLRALCLELGVNPRIEVDGGVTLDNVESIVAAGADTIVAGSTVFRAEDRCAAISELRRRGTRGMAVMG